jgi:hypothetical protein
LIDWIAARRGRGWRRKTTDDARAMANEG